MHAANRLAFDDERAQRDSGTCAAERRGDEGVFRPRPGGARPKALDAKTKELIALAISVAVRCDDCIAFHTKAAVEQGATREEVLETLGMAIYMGAGPSVMYASHALGAFTQFEAAKAASANNG